MTVESPIRPLLSFEEPLTGKDGKVTARWRDWFRQLEQAARALQGDVDVLPGTFLALPDTPNAYTGQALKVLRVAASEITVEFGVVLGTMATATAADYTPTAGLLAAIQAIDGPGSGIDADTLDGSSSAAFATAGHTHAHFTDTANPHSVTKAQVGLGNVTDNAQWHAGNDGPGSGLDADTVDGQHAAAFAAAVHTHLVAALSDASANAQSLLQAANYAAMKALLDVESGTDFLSPAAIAAAYQPLDGTLTSLALVAGVQGDLLYASGADAWTKLVKDTSATRYLANTGTSNNPAWAQINLANGVTGDLPFANLTQIAGLSVLGVTGTGTADVDAITGTANQSLRVNAAGTALVFGTVNLAGMADLSQYQLIGRTSSGSGVPQAKATSADVWAMLGSASDAALRTEIGLGTSDIPTFQGINSAGTNQFFVGLTITQTRTASDQGPYILLVRTSTGAADNDFIGAIRFNYVDDAGNAQTGPEVSAVVLDSASGSEDDRLDFYATVAGTRAQRVFVGAGLYTSGVTDPGANNIAATGLYSGQATAILHSRTTITGGGTGLIPTLTAGPVAGNPTKWLPYDDNGTTRYIPSW